MSTTTALSFIHRFEPATRPGRPPLLLLHGTGGDEADLLELGREVAPGSALISPRGKVLENGMPRFFRRLTEGVFDEADLRLRADDLANFVANARDTYNMQAPVALGFSNGANIAAAMLMLRPDTLAGAALLRPMAPFADAPRAKLAGKSVLILSGVADPIVPAANSERLQEELTARAATVDRKVLQASHGLTQADVTAVAAWMQGLTR